MCFLADTVVMFALISCRSCCVLIFMSLGGVAARGFVICHGLDRAIRSADAVRCNKLLWRYVSLGESALCRGGDGFDRSPCL